MRGGVVRIFPRIDKTSTVLSAIRSSKEGISRTEISGVLGRHTTSKEISLILQNLSKEGLASGNLLPTCGRYKEVWTSKGVEW